MSKYYPHIVIILLVFIVLMNCNQLRKTNDKLQSIHDDIIRSETREQLALDKLDTLEKEERKISMDTIEINKRHENIRNNPITDPIYDSLMRSVYTRGKERFD